MAEKGKKEINKGFDLEEMAKAGLHFGHKTSKVHPKMEPYLFGVRNGIYLVNLEKTKEKLKEAFDFIEGLILDKKVLLVVGTKIQIKDMVKDFALECELPYVSERWLGGTFTNLEVMKKRIKHFKELEEQKEKGELEKYTKKERAQINSEIKDLERKFGGIKDMEDLPDAVFILSMERDNLAVKESREKGVKIVAISDSDTNPRLADYPIPANDDAVSSIRYILEKAKEVILKAKEKREKEEKKEGKKEEKESK